MAAMDGVLQGWQSAIGGSCTNTWQLMNDDEDQRR